MEWVIWALKLAIWSAYQCERSAYTTIGKVMLLTLRATGVYEFVTIVHAVQHTYKKYKILVEELLYTNWQKWAFIKTNFSFQRKYKLSQ